MAMKDTSRLMKHTSAMINWKLYVTALLLPLALGWKSCSVSPAARGEPRTCLGT